MRPKDKYLSLNGGPNGEINIKNTKEINFLPLNTDEIFVGTRFKCQGNMERSRNIDYMENETSIIENIQTPSISSLQDVSYEDYLGDFCSDDPLFTSMKTNDTLSTAQNKTQGISKIKNVPAISKAQKILSYPRPIVKLRPRIQEKAAETPMGIEEAKLSSVIEERPTEERPIEERPVCPQDSIRCVENSSVEVLKLIEPPVNSTFTGGRDEEIYQNQPRSYIRKLGDFIKYKMCCGDM